jgi:hypothetical protein
MMLHKNNTPHADLENLNLINAVVGSRHSKPHPPKTSSEEAVAESIAGNEEHSHEI